MQTVLLVEPDDATRELYKRTLNRHYRVFASSNVAEAIEWVQNQNVQAVIVEPFSGSEAIAQLQALTVTHDIPLIICTASDEWRRLQGTAAYLVKPVLPSTLLSTLEQTLTPSISRSIT